MKQRSPGMIYYQKTHIGMDHVSVDIVTTEGTSGRVHTTHYVKGTSSYRSPELVKDGIYTNKVDIWAMGCIFYEIIFRHKAFRNDNAVYDYYHHHKATGEKVGLPFDERLITNKSQRTYSVPRR